MSATDKPRLGTSRQWMPIRSSRSNTMLRSRRKSWAMTACATSAKLVGAASTRVLQDRTALRDEDDEMPVGDPLHAFDQQLGRDRVDEIGEQDHQRAALEPRIELGEPEREIGLLVVIVEFGGRALEAREAGDAAHRRHVLPHDGIEAVGADEVAALQRHPGEHQAGIDGVIEPRDAVDRLAASDSRCRTP